MNEDSSRTDLSRLTRLAARLRAPDGCPWDRAQGLADVRAYLLEEAHEAAAALDPPLAADPAAPAAGAVPSTTEPAAAWTSLAEELGDLLFQAAFVVRLGEERGGLDLGGVLDGIEAKMIERHPHVFGEEAGGLADAGEVAEAWERRKAEAEPDRSQLAGVPASLPALLAAYRLTQKAAGVGFDWRRPEEVVAKVEEELAEVVEEMRRGAAERGEGEGARGNAGSEEEGAEVTSGGERTGAAGARSRRLREEVGDLLFAVANLARKLDVDPEAALAGANAKFRRRFEAIERSLAERGSSPAASSLEEMDALWEEVKREEEAEGDERKGRLGL